MLFYRMGPSHSFTRVRDDDKMMWFEKLTRKLKDICRK